MPKFSSDVEFPCPVCTSERFERLSTMWCPRITGLTAPVSICFECGFVTVRPRWEATAYKEINSLWYPHKFAAAPPTDTDEEKKFSKWRTMWERIGDYYLEAPRVLDVGAGQGWAIEFLQLKFPDLKAVAIEQWQPSREYITSRLGATALDLDIGDDWPAIEGGPFDLVILRHTLEHIYDPLKVLQQIAGQLARGGYAYIVVPNALRIKEGHAVRTDFFRPVHLHYFNESTLVRLAGRAGLEPVVQDSSGEVWGLFHLGDPVTAPDVGPPSYSEQRAHMVERLFQTRWLDLTCPRCLYHSLC